MRNVLNVITHNKCDIMHGVKHVLNYNLHLLFIVLMNESGLRNKCRMIVKNAYLFIILCKNKYLIHHCKNIYYGIIHMHCG